MATLAADLLLPFVQWRDLRRAVQLSETDYEREILAFRQSLYQALAEVEDGLSARRLYRERQEKLEISLRAAQGAEQLYRLRYQAGAVPLKFWLDAQEARRQAEEASAENRLALLQRHIALCLALGGDVEQ